MATITEAAAKECHGNGATVVDLKRGSPWRVDADALILATTNRPETWLHEELSGSSLEHRAVGD